MIFNVKHENLTCYSKMTGLYIQALVTNKRLVVQPKESKKEPNVKEIKY